MKVEILNEYFDKKLDRNVKVSEVIEIDIDKANRLEIIGIGFNELDEDKLNEDDIELIESYKADKNIVDGLKADDLKILCDEFDINYTNAKEAKEALKIVTFG